MRVSGMSGNEMFCLHEKGFEAGELVVGNSVCSLGVIGGIGAWGTGITGGELTSVTSLISEGRHQAIERMVKEAEKHGAVGITSVTSELRTLGGYMEFLAQGTGVTGPNSAGHTFSTAASGMELYCHLDAGYEPKRFAMGNVAYALGLGRGITGSVRTMARGEVREFSKMYNDIRHLALERLQKEALGDGANAVVDVKVRLQAFGPTATELLMTGTASNHPLLVTPKSHLGVVTSELTGEELWNLARMGLVPVQLVMATSVYSLGVVGGIGTMFQGMSRGELPELTKLIYEARENCLDILRKEAEKVGATSVIGNRLSIRELSPGLVEVMAIGTAVRKAEGMAPATPLLIPQAIIIDGSSLENDPLGRADSNLAHTAMQGTAHAGRQAQGCIGAVVSILFTIFIFGFAILAAIFGD